MSKTIDVGIDLGTTNSSIAICRNGEVRLFQTTDLMNVTPSVVYVSKSGRMLVGRRAYDTWVADPDNAQAEFKRWMGYSDTLLFPASGKRLSAEDLSAEILKALRADFERQSQRVLTAAVITVPAAFGSLQCDATTRAAGLAGLDEAPLLQEPIAAAVAFGASPASRNQRWMVFDFGGGTLDIAIVSTRDGRLAVLEHQGNNRLGGKDIDRVIAEKMLAAPLSDSFTMPEADTPAHRRLMRALVRQAEQAKIALSSAGQTTVDLFDIGEDAAGKTIEMTLVLKRSELETHVQPIVDECLALARRALDGARVSAGELDRVLLVGGPTQMPLVRAGLTSLGVTLDHSLDPMTAVSHGAALYASTIERTTAAPAEPATASNRPGTTSLQLAYERASGTSKSPVAVILDPNAGIADIKIDATGGYWTSGWLPVVNGCAQTEVLLDESKPATHYTVAARDARGGSRQIDPAEFAIAYMLPMAAPPLPHTMAIELSVTNGVAKFDPVFPRHTPLPAEARKTYTADRTLRPSDIDATLPIKFWEIDVSDDPQEKWWAGSVHIRSEWVRRPIPEGAKLELTIKIDKSRKMSVELFVPVLNQSFSENVYIPDAPGARSTLEQQLDLCFDRLNVIRDELYEAERDDLTPRFEKVEYRLESISETVDDSGEKIAVDPDSVARTLTEIRWVRGQLSYLEEQLSIGSAATGILQKLRRDVDWTERVVNEHGTDTDRKDLERVMQQYDRFKTAGDARGLKWVRNAFITIRWRILENAAWHWNAWLTQLRNPETVFLNKEVATQLLADAESAQARNDTPALRKACSSLIDLLPPDQAKSAREQEAASGLRPG